MHVQNVDHHNALRHVLSAVESLTFSFAKAEITQVVTATAETAAAGILGGGALGTTSRDPIITLFAAALGGSAGAYVGQMIDKEVAAYEAVLLYGAQWQIRAIAL